MTKRKTNFRARELSKKNRTTVDMRTDFFTRVVNELGLHHESFFAIGNAAHHFPANPMYRDAALKESLCCYMVVDVPTFTYLVMNKGLTERKVNGHRLLALAGPGAHGQGGVIFVLAQHGLSVTHNTTAQVEKFLWELVSFTDYMSGAVSMNILAMMASSETLSKTFKEKFDFEFAKNLLRYQSNLGPSMFMEPHYLYHGICLVNMTREVPGWNIDPMNGNTPMCDYLLEMYDRVKELEKDDPDMITYREHLCNPNYLNPNEAENARDEDRPPLFQEKVIPNPDVVTPFDPEL